MHRCLGIVVAVLCFFQPCLGSAKEKDKEKEEPSANLAIPAELPGDARKSLEEAVEAFKKADEAKEGQNLISKALTKLKSAGQKAPKSPLPLYYLGILYQWKKNYPEAKRVLEKALKLNPTFHEAIVELADVHVWQKDLKGSLPLYDDALKLQPTYRAGLERKGITLLRLGKLSEAKNTLLQAQKPDPNPFLTRTILEIDVEMKGPDWLETFTRETENYRVFTPVSQDFANEIGARAELIRRAYNKIFPGVDKPDRKYPIWVYRDAESYHRAGGPMAAGGHYAPHLRKLVLFKYPSKETTFLVLNHEAFHQYLHDYLDLAPQWFNEGLGDYFGPYEYVREGKREFMVSRPNKGRLDNVQEALRQKMCPPASELMLMSQQEMYRPSMAAIHYAQAWAMMYFMIEGKKPEYKNLLINYFGALRKGLDLDEAYKTTFGRIDMAKFDKEWKGFVMGLKRN